MAGFEFGAFSFSLILHAALVGLPAAAPLAFLGGGAASGRPGRSGGGAIPNLQSILSRVNTPVLGAYGVSQSFAAIEAGELEVHVDEATRRVKAGLSQGVLSRHQDGGCRRRAPSLRCVGIPGRVPTISLARP